MGLDLGAPVLAEQAHLTDAALHLACLLLLLQLLLSKSLRSGSESSGYLRLAPDAA